MNDHHVLYQNAYETCLRDSPFRQIPGHPLRYNLVALATLLLTIKRLRRCIGDTDYERFMLYAKKWKNGELKKFPERKMKNEQK